MGKRDESRFLEQIGSKALDVLGVCFSGSQLWGSAMSFACKLWPTLHVQIIYSGWGKKGNCNSLWIADADVLGCRNSAGKITKCGECARKPACVPHVSVLGAGGHSILTHNQYAPALIVHVNLACHCVSRGRPRWHFDRLKKHCWAARNPPERKGQTDSIRHPAGFYAEEEEEEGKKGVSEKDDIIHQQENHLRNWTMNKLNLTGMSILWLIQQFKFLTNLNISSNWCKKSHTSQTVLLINFQHCPQWPNTTRDTEGKATIVQQNTN